MHDDIVKRPPTTSDKQSTDTNVEKPAIINNDQKSPQTGPANIDIVNTNAEVKPKSEEKPSKPKDVKPKQKDTIIDKNLPEEASGPKKASNIPVLPISLAVITCLILIVLVVMAQLKNGN